MNYNQILAECQLGIDRAVGIPKWIIKPSDRVEAIERARGKARRWVRRHTHRGRKTKSVLVIDDPGLGKYIIMSPEHKQKLLERYATVFPSHLSFISPLTFEGLPIIDDRWSITDLDENG